jgi:predicted ATP-dependent serine protease
LNPNSNIRWIEKYKSVKNTFAAIAKFLRNIAHILDTDSLHKYTCTAGDLDKLLEQTQHQRVMSISNTAGIDKSTVLTQISKQFEQ